MMKLSELIAAVGDDKVEFQNLDKSVETMETVKDGEGSRFTFVSVMPFDLHGTDKLGLVVWLDRKRVENAVRDWEAKHAKAKQAQAH